MDSHQEEFSLEEQVFWCIRHLEKKLQTKNINPKEAKTLMQSLKMLANEKTPLIKKRQIMRVTCGDYRAVMQEETKNLKKQIKKNKITSVENAKESRFLQKSVAMGHKDEMENARGEENPSVFLFNFPEIKDDEIK